MPMHPLDASIKFQLDWHLDRIGKGLNADGLARSLSHLRSWTVQARELSVELLVKWLSSYKFKG